MLNISPLEQLMTYSRAKFMHNYVYIKLAPSFFNMWETNREKKTIYVNYAMYIPGHRIELFKRMPLVSLPTVRW